MVGAAELAAAGGNTVVINLGRGALIDENALVEALEVNKVKGAALDVSADCSYSFYFTTTTTITTIYPCHHNT